MVGRVLPNSRPHGEDHRGAEGGGQMGILRRTNNGAATPGYRSLIRRATFRMHTALGFLHGAARALLATLFSLRV